MLGQELARVRALMNNFINYQPKGLPFLPLGREAPPHWAVRSAEVWLVFETSTPGPRVYVRMYVNGRSLPCLMQSLPVGKFANESM